ncbi:MAG: Na+/H+ antiporter subunit E [Verrucomicrobiota bacterium]
MSRVFASVSFLLFYLAEVVKSNFRVAHDVLTPRHRMKPGIISVDVSGMTDRQLLFMANFITMTPGTLGLTFSDDHTKLYIHAMYIDGGEASLAEELKNTYGKRVCRVF